MPRLHWGADVQVQTLEGKVTLTIPAGVQSGAKFRMKGKGVKNIKGYGKGRPVCYH